MNKIPTLLVRDPQNLAWVLPEVHPDCGWVLAGEGTPTRKYDGTCVALLGGIWWARREIPEGKSWPDAFQPVTRDPVTGKTVGWESADRSGFWRWLQEALAEPGLRQEGTYELIGPKVNRNRERVDRHRVIRHLDAERLSFPGLLAPTTIGGIRDAVATLGERFGYEGVVWHHPDGRMAKLKARDFAAAR